MNISIYVKTLLVALCIISCVCVKAQTPQHEYAYGSSGNAIPLGNPTSSWSNYKSQFLYHPGFYTPTAPPVGLITAVYFKIASNCNATVFSNLIVSLGNTTQTALTTTYVTGLTQGLNATTFNAPSVSSGGWLKITLTTPVMIDFTKPLVVDVSQTSINGGSAGGYDIQTGTGPVGGNAHTYGNTGLTTGTARTLTYRFGFDVITCSTAVTHSPVAATICEEDGTDFTMAGVDIGTYQWQVNQNGGSFSDVTDGSIYSGAQTGTLSVNNVPYSANGSAYRCIIAKPGCKDTTDEAVLTVNGLVKLEPLDAKDTTCITATKDLVIKGDGSIVNYRWQVLVPGVGYVDVPTAPPYTHLGHVLRITGVPDTLDGGKFRCIVDGICDTAISTELELNVAPIPSVGLSPRDTFVKPGSIAIFKAEATAAGARYQWQAAPPLGNFVNLNDGGIYSGVKTSQLIVKGISTVQNNFRFRCIIMSSLLCNSPGDTSDEAVLSVDKTSVNNIDGTVSIVLYPNPANASDLYISSTVMASGRKFGYKIVDKTGRVIKAGALSDNNTRIDIGGLAADIYIVQITEQGRIVAQEKFTRL